MIKRKIVFIIGAGASNDFGFPVGSELIAEIHNSLNSLEAEQTFARHGIRPRFFQRFGKDLVNSSVQSIDEFIAKQPKYEQIGKLLIALNLVKYEKEDVFTPFQSNWLTYIWQNMSQSSNPEDFLRNDVSFIIFNYDRLIEQFIYSRLQHAFGLETQEEVLKYYSTVNFFHPFGKLGHLPWEEKYYNRSFMPDFGNYESVDEIAKDLITIHEAFSNQNKKIKFAIDEAKTVCYLGNGYHDSNLNLFPIPSTPSRQIIGTTKGLTPTKRQLIASNTTGKLISLPDEELGCLDLLQTHVNL